MSHLSAYQGVKWEGESFQSAGDTDSYLSCSTEHTEVHFPESEYGMDYVKANQLKLVWRITKNLLQSSCFRKIPDIFIGIQLAAQETLTTANPTLTVCLGWNPGLKFKIFRDNNFNPAVCPHICSSEISSKSLPFPEKCIW